MIFLYIILAVLVLMLMIVIHELGHYTVGKLLGFHINEFSIGFGPKIIGRRSKKSGELFSVRALPLGGYCSFYGEDDDASDTLMSVGEFVSNADVSESDKRLTFTRQKPWKRILVLLAGAGFNLFSAFLFSFIYIIAVGYTVPTVQDLYENPDNGEPYASGLADGDRITAVDGISIGVLDSFTELTGGLTDGDGVVLTVERDGEYFDVPVTKRKMLVPDGNGGYTESSLIGIRISYETVNVSFFEAVGLSFPFTFKMAGMVFASFGQLITGRVPITSLTGPVGTVTAIATMAETGWQYLLLLLPLIASNLAIFNLLPVPSLDGARVIFTAIEWIRKKPINRTVEAYIHGIGLALLLGFVVVVDIIGIFSRFI